MLLTYKFRFNKQKEDNEHRSLLSECKSIDSLEYSKINQNKSNLKHILDSNTIEVHKKIASNKDSQIKKADKAKILAQMSFLAKADTRVKDDIKRVFKDHAEEVHQQRLNHIQQKELEKKARVIEEKKVLESNIQHLDKMERRYKNIFDDIGKKHNAIQEQYKKLSPERKNLADYEKFRDTRINEFTNKQISEYELKMQQEEEKRRQRRLFMLNDMQVANQMQIQSSIAK